MNDLDGEKQTFLHILLMANEYNFVKNLLYKYKEAFNFDITIKNSEGQDAKVKHTIPIRVY